MTVVLTVEATKSFDGKAGFKVPVVELELGGAAAGAQLRADRHGGVRRAGGPPGTPVKVAHASDTPMG